MSVWFWLATLVVLPASFLVLPRLAGWFPGTPAVVFLVIIYLVTGLSIGFALDVTGLWRIKGLIREAQLWERSGISTRAEKKFIKAVRIYDSAWLSWLAARRAWSLLASTLARFYLASGSERREIQGAAGAWLAANPKDRTLARFWLERMQEHLLSNTSAQYVLSALADHWYGDPELCRMLVDLFLKLGRMDFSARRLYRSFLDLVEKDSLATEKDRAHVKMIREIMSARLDTPEPALESGRSTPDPDYDTTFGDEKTKAEDFKSDDKGLLAGIQNDETFAGEVETLGMQRGGMDDIEPREPVRRSALLSSIRKGAAGWTSSIAGRTGKAKDAALHFMQARERFWKWARPVILGCLGIWLAAFAWGTFSHMFKEAEQPPAKQIKVAIPKPFTIQVAAYLKQKHADRYVADLAEKGVQAATRISKAGGKTWYLVRVSEFTDQKSAQAYGNRLKADHLIDDFFVKNK